MGKLSKIIQKLIRQNIDSKREDVSHHEGLYHLKSIKDNKSPIPIQTNRAKTIYLPKLRFEREYSPEERINQDWITYWKVYNRGYSFYKRKWYSKAREEFLIIHAMNHAASAYFTHLIRTYRKLIESLFAKRKYKEAYNLSSEMFLKCPNVTNSDIITYNKLVKSLQTSDNNFKAPPKNRISENKVPFRIESECITCISSTKRRRGYKSPSKERQNILDLKGKSHLAAESLNHIDFDADFVNYRDISDLPKLSHEYYRFKESFHRDIFIISDKSLNIYVYNWNFALLSSFNASRYASSYSHLRCIDLSPNQELFLFTNVDNAYLLDRQMNLLAAFAVPHKEGYVYNAARESNSDSGIKESLISLQLSNHPSKKEIKAAFRSMALKYHPDINPNDPMADEKTKKIIEAYETLTSEDAEKAFENHENEGFWAKTISTYKIQMGNQEYDFTISLISQPEDWIYGTGISYDGNGIYLGCYSGINI